MPITLRRQFSARMLILPAVALGACTLFYYATKFGVGLANDSMDYFSTAQSIRAGRGVLVYNPNPEQGQQWIPLTVFPPMYPALLALSSWIFHSDVTISARILHMLLLAGNVLLAGGLAFLMTRSIFLAAVIAGLPAALMLEIHTSGLSEAAFIFFALAGLCALAGHLRNEKLRSRWILLLISAICVSAAMLTRYAGACLLAAGVIALLLPREGKYLHRMFFAAVFVGVSLLPILIWTIHIGSLSRATGREMLFHPPDSKALRQGTQIILGWFAPLDWYLGRTHTGSLLFVVCTLLMLWALRSRAEIVRVWNNPALLVVLIFAALYLPFLLISMTFFDALIALNSRMLSPLLVPLLAIIAAALDRSLIKPATRAIAIGFICLFVTLHLGGAIQTAIRSHHNGLEFNSRAWKNSEILRQALALPPSAPIYTNGWDVLYLSGSRASYSLPGVFQRKKGQSVSQTRIDAQMTAMKAGLSRGGYLVYFDNLDSRSSFLATPQQAMEFMPLEIVFSNSDKAKSPNSGTIYRLGTGPATGPSTAPN